MLSLRKVSGQDEFHITCGPGPSGAEGGSSFHHCRQVSSSSAVGAELARRPHTQSETSGFAA